MGETTSHAEDPDAVDQMLENLHTSRLQRERVQKSNIRERLEFERFLAARLDEDEAAIPPEGEDPFLPHGQHWSEVPFPMASAARALLVLESFRRIVELHSPQASYDDRYDCKVCVNWVDLMHEEVLFEDYPCPTLRLVAAAYAGHPEYRDEWRPVEARGLPNGFKPSTLQVLPPDQQHGDVTVDRSDGEGQVTVDLYADHGHICRECGEPATSSIKLPLFADGEPVIKYFCGPCAPREWKR